MCEPCAKPVIFSEPRQCASSPTAALTFYGQLTPADAVDGAHLRFCDAVVLYQTPQRLRGRDERLRGQLARPSSYFRTSSTQSSRSPLPKALLVCSRRTSNRSSLTPRIAPLGGPHLRRGQCAWLLCESSCRGSSPMHRVSCEAVAVSLEFVYTCQPCRPHLPA